MRAMGLNRLAETAAALLKRNTGIVATFGDVSIEDVLTLVEGEASTGDADEKKEYKSIEGYYVKSNNNTASGASATVKSEILTESDNAENDDNTTSNVFLNPVPEPLHISKAKARAAKAKADKLAKANKKKGTVVKLEPVENAEMSRK